MLTSWQRQPHPRATTHFACVLSSYLIEHEKHTARRRRREGAREIGGAMCAGVSDQSTAYQFSLFFFGSICQMTSAFFQRTRRGVREEGQRRETGGDRVDLGTFCLCGRCETLVNDLPKKKNPLKKKKRKEQNPMVKNRRLLPVGRQIDECIRLNERKKGSCPVERTAISNRCFDQMT